MEISAQIPSFKNFFSEKKDQNIGVVRSTNYEIPGNFRLESGKTLSRVRIEYEMYGKMNADTVLHQLDQKIIYPHYDFKHLTEKYFEIGMKLDDFLIQLVKYC